MAHPWRKRRLQPLPQCHVVSEGQTQNPKLKTPNRCSLAFPDLEPTLTSILTPVGHARARPSESADHMILPLRSTKEVWAFDWFDLDVPIQFGSMFILPTCLYVVQRHSRMLLGHEFVRELDQRRVELFLHRAFQGVVHGLRGMEIGLAQFQMDNGAALSFQFFGSGEDGKRAFPTHDGHS